MFYQRNGVSNQRFGDQKKFIPPKHHPIFAVGEKVQVMNLKPEPGVMDYHRRKAWFISNFVGEVVKSTGEVLTVRNFKNDFIARVHYSAGLTIHTLSERDIERLRQYSPHFFKN